jgi:uncharacterized protein YndB with AHSA1/START domain
MEKGNETISRDLTITRVFQAPLELVWEVWTNGRHIQQWWSPKGFTNPVTNWNAKPGNKIHIDMKGPDGTVYPMGGEFLEVSKPDRLVFVSAALDGNGKSIFEVTNTVSFKDLGGATEMILNANVSKTSPDADQYLSGMNEGWNQSLDKLNDFMNSENRELVFERTLNAPQEIVWEAWTNPEHLANWWGPTGFSLTTNNMDVKAGGTWKFMMHGPDGRDYPNKIQFIEVSKPEKLVYKHMDDGETEPVSFEVTVTMEKLGDKTKLTMRMLFPTAQDLVRVSKEYGAIEGAHQTIARLEDLLKNMAN